MTVLREREPRILGGRDDLAGGTWLAVNEHGVVAGLTNRPVSGGRDPAKRSRGELPLAFTRAAGAAEAVARVVRTIDPDAYNPCWLLVGDRRSLFSVEIVAGSPAAVRPLGPGAYVLENRALGAASAKVDHVMAVLATVPSEPAARTAALKALLADHDTPAPRGDEEPHVVTVAPDAAPRPAELSANCVHTEGYGTRS